MEQTVEIIVLTLTAIPVVRLILTRPVRRELRERPAYAVVCALGAGLGIGFVIWAANHSVDTLRYSAAIGAALATGAIVRARPNYGKSRGLPPGSLGLAASIPSVHDEHYYARQADRWGPVFKMSQLHSPVVCIVDLPRGLEFLERNRESLQQSALPFARLIPGSYIEFMNGEHHERFRGILRPALLGPAVTACRPYVAEVVCAALAEMASRGGDRGVEPGEFFDRIALDSLLCIFFGVRRGDDRFKRFRSLYALIDFRRGFYTRAPRALTEGFERAVSEVRAIIEETRVDPPDEANSSVLTEVLRANAAAGDDETLTTVIGNLVFLVAVARDDLQGFLMWVFKMCCDHPQYAMRLRDGDADEQRLSMHIVKETLRLRQSEYVYRDLIEDCRFGDYRIPKGWRIRLCLAESHRLASVFPEPEQFDPQRFADRSYSKTEYCPFSDGDHACFGTRVVMVVSQTFLFELASGFDWQIVADGPVERGNRQWHHWKPSSRLRVAMKLRTT